MENQTIKAELLSKLEFYMLMSNDKFFRTKGYNGYGESWIDDIKKAKVWTRIGPARSAQTFFSDQKYLSKGFPIPTIVKLTPLGVEMIDDTDRIKKAQVKKFKSEKKKLENTLNNQEHKLLSMKGDRRNYSENQMSSLEKDIQYTKNKIRDFEQKIKC